MSSDSKKWTVEYAQQKIWEYGVEEARAKAEKAQTELETAKLHQEYVRGLIERDLYSNLTTEKIGGLN